MKTGLKFDYYYGIEAEQFSFYRVPRMLIKDERFKDLSSDAKLLYGLMLDRMSLSIRNGWLDEENRAYIHYTIENIMEDFGCAKATATKMLTELDGKKGIGLIEKKRQGLGRPDIIYVKNFAAMESENETDEDEKTAGNTDVFTEVQNLGIKNPKKQESRSSEIELPEVQNLGIRKFKKKESRGSEIELSEVQNLENQKFKNQTSRSSEIESPEVQFLNPNYNNNSYTDMNQNNIDHITPSYVQNEVQYNDGMDSVKAYMDIIRKNIEYDVMLQNSNWKDAELYEELYQLICEVVCVKRQTIRIEGEEYPYELVKSKFLKLTSSHLLYVIESMKNTSTRITNIKAYMITALYNATNTMNHYYQQAVQHDMYGGGWQDKGII